MKANELMIGDWVYNHRNWECPIVEIHKNSAVVIAKHYGEEEFLLSDLRPIPLTSEILKKNGFVNVENTQTSTIMYSFRDSLFRIEVYDFNHITIDSYYTDSSCDIFVSSVHEFQHALKLCGIEKEIIL